jgi:hypothetical protein
MTRRLSTLLLIVVALSFVGAGPAAASVRCVGVGGSTCGVESDPHAGEFHGLIAVAGAPWVLDTSLSAGGNGCADCTWTVLIACPTESPSDPGSSDDCAVDSHSVRCGAGQLLFRIYLTTAAVTDHVVGTICLGRDRQVVSISDEADADVHRYLKTVVPPDLQITTRPSTATLAGLPTRFAAAPPADLRPVPFGGPAITETITIDPDQMSWRFGDGGDSGWVPTDRTVTHSYLSGRTAHGRVATRWRATYTITFDGRTVGPFDGDGRLTKDQAFRLAVRTTTPRLVSH